MFLYYQGKEKKRVIRSQFACTYADDGLPLNRVLNFPSTTLLPTGVHPAPKPLNIPANVLHESDSEFAEKCEKQGNVSRSETFTHMQFKRFQGSSDYIVCMMFLLAVWCLNFKY